MNHKTYSIAEGEMSYCGDHYCNGHRQVTVKCSCGKTLYKGEKPFESFKRYPAIHQAHRVAVALGEE